MTVGVCEGTLSGVEAGEMLFDGSDDATLLCRPWNRDLQCPQVALRKMRDGAPLDTVSKSTSFGCPTHEVLEPTDFDTRSRPNSVQSLLEAHLDGWHRPPRAPSNFASLADQQVVGLKQVLGAFNLGEVHVRHVRQVDAVPLNVLVAQIRHRGEFLPRLR
nr:hypothetical protein [Candidatus Poriferisodalis multihospitum]